MAIQSECQAVLYLKDLFVLISIAAPTVRMGNKL